jgi:pimeloyl-ACP methyl ester carboxylesterase
MNTHWWASCVPYLCGGRDSREEAEAELLAARNFAKWHPESLRAYVGGAVVKVSRDNNVLDPESKYGLALHPHIEAAVYSNDTMPLSEEAMARVQCPTTFHYGSRTQLFFPEFKQPLVDKYPHIYKIRAPVPNTSHALVVEDADAIADCIVQDLAELPAFQ